MLRKAVALALALLVVPTAGCSWAFMQKAPEPIVAPHYPVHCTRSRTAPVLDSICAGYYGLSAAIIASTPTCTGMYDDASCFDAQMKTTGLVIGATLAALCLTSAVSGFNAAARCEVVETRNVACIAGDLAACQALTPGWRPPTSTWTPPPSWRRLQAPAGPVPPASPPAQRADGLPEGENCTAAWQCRTGLSCQDGFCER
jgi:hypothetical protein